MRLMVRTTKMGLAALCLALLGCDSGPESSGRGDDEAGPTAPADRAIWWQDATVTGSGRERILAPRELNALLAQGRRYGFDRDDAWWKEKRRWVSKRVLALDPEDLEANDAEGRRALQSSEGFADLWSRMLGCRAPNSDIDALIEQYDPFVQDGSRRFLDAGEWEVVTSRLQKVRAYLDHLDRDHQFAVQQIALSQVSRHPLLNRYPFVHVTVGPFLIFFSARDLQTIEGEDASAEADRVASRKEYYVKRLERMSDLYEGVLQTMRRRLPELPDLHARTDQALFKQWIFGDVDAYREFAEELRKANAARPYRSGFFHRKDGWAFLFELAEQKAGVQLQPVQDPAEEDATGRAPAFNPGAIRRGSHPLEETAAYLATLQILDAWGVDKRDRTINHMQNSRALWLREGLAADVAASLVKEPAIGQLLKEAHTFKLDLPLRAVHKLAECESWFNLDLYQEPVVLEDQRRTRRLRFRATYSDLAWLFVDTVRRDPYRASFVRFLRDQADGRSRGGVGDFEKAFKIENEAGWAELELTLRGRWDELAKDG